MMCIIKNSQVYSNTSLYSNETCGNAVYNSKGSHSTACSGQLLCVHTNGFSRELMSCVCLRVCVCIFVCVCSGVARI